MIYCYGKIEFWNIRKFGISELPVIGKYVFKNSLLLWDADRKIQFSKTCVCWFDRDRKIRF